MAPHALPPMSWSTLCRLTARSPGPIRWAWAAVRQPTGEWRLAHLAARAPAAAQPQRLRYRDAVIVVEQLTPRGAARRLRAGVAAPRSAVGHELAFPVPSGDVHPRWLTTEEDDVIVHRNDWPELLHTFTLDGQTGSPTEPLHGPGLPFFPHFAAAVGDLVLERPLEPSRRQQQVGAVIRLTDRRARLRAPVVRETSATFGLEAAAALDDGWTARAAWRGDPADAHWKTLDRPVSVDTALTIDFDAVPYELHVALTDPAGQLVDQRGWSGGGAQAEPGPQQLEARVRRWLQEGEHRQVEFKQSLREDKARVRFAESVAAMANTTGGVVLVGVDDGGSVVGYDMLKAADQLTQIVSAHVEDPPHIEVRGVVIDDRPVQIVYVNASPAGARPHVVHERVLVRAGATNRPATSREIRDMTMPPADPTPWLLG